VKWAEQLAWRQGWLLLEPPLPHRASHYSLAPLAEEVTTFDKFAGMSVHMAVPSTFR